MKFRNIFIGLLALLVSLGALAFAEDVSAAKSTAAKKAIKEYVQQDQALKGAFLIRDSRTSTVRELTFDYVHDTVHETEDGRYFACVDFKQGEKVLDLDFYLEETPGGHFQISDIVIHKIDGKDVTKE